MCNKAKQTSKSNVQLDATKIVARIIKGFSFLLMDEAQKRRQRDHVAQLVEQDFHNMDRKEFVRKYIEWVPVEMSAQILGVKKDHVTKLIAAASLRPTEPQQPTAKARRQKEQASEQTSAAPEPQTSDAPQTSEPEQTSDAPKTDGDAQA